MLEKNDEDTISRIAFSAAEKVAESTKTHFETLLKLQDERLAATKIERHYEIQQALNNHISSCEAKRETITLAAAAVKDAAEAKTKVAEIQNRVRGVWWIMTVLGTIIATIAAIIVEIFRK